MVHDSRDEEMQEGRRSTSCIWVVAVVMSNYENEEKKERDVKLKNEGM